MILYLLFIGFSVHGQDYGVIDYLYSARRVVSKPSYSESYFGPLESYQVHAVRVTEDQYPWIARVVQSTSSHLPHMCTAVCVEQRIFITTARCIQGLKVIYTMIIYKTHHFPVVAFVLPSNPTKQAFDDIGFVVVNDEDFQEEWSPVQLFTTTNRTDDNFDWFAKLYPSKETFDHAVVGYATEKGIHIIRSPYREYNLTKLDVVVNINICPEIFISTKVKNVFRVPCYCGCSVTQFKAKNAKCSNYHGVLGGAVVHMKTNKLLGIATWGSYSSKCELPVGFSVPNSKNFFEDYTCARKIKNYKGLLITDGNYQALCEDIH